MKLVTRVFAFLSVALFAFGCSQQVPTTYQPEDSVPGLGTSELTIELGHGVGPALMSLGSPMSVPIPPTVNNETSLIGNLFRTANNYSTEWKRQVWPVGSPMTVTTINGSWYLLMPFIGGMPQVGNFTLNGQVLGHYVQTDENQGIWAQVKVLPSADDTTGVQLYQREDNQDQFINILYVIPDPPPADFTSIRMVGTQNNWNQSYPEMHYTEDFGGQWENWLPALKSHGVKIAFKGPSGSIINLPVYAKTDAMAERVLLDCTEAVGDVNTFFANTSWYTDRSWLTGQRVYRVIVRDDGTIEQGCGGVALPSKLYVYNPNIASTHQLMGVMTGVNGEQPFPLARVGDHWEYPAEFHTGPFAVSVWDTSDEDKPVVNSIYFGSTTGPKLVSLEVYQGPPPAEPTVHFVGVLTGPPLAVSQGPDNRTGDLGH